MRVARIGRRLARLEVLAGFLLVAVCGCHRMEQKASPQYVYVAAEHTFLRNRVAPVAKFVAEVTNGERLKVLDHQTRFYKVKAPNGKVGWIEQYYIIDQPEMDKFDALRKEYAKTRPEAKAVLEETSYLHDAPGPKAPHYYLLPSQDKLDMLMRASVPRRESTLAMLRRKRAIQKGKTPPPVPMRNYWLVRDAQGRTGWVRGSALRPDVPNSVLVLAPGERMIGAYLLRKVKDPKSHAPNHEVPEYVAVFSPYRAGLPYDYNEIRVFTWDVPRHHYETAYSVHHIEGFFPVKVGHERFGRDRDPVFSFQISKNPNIHLNEQTGRMDPGPTITVKYRMEGVIAREIKGPRSLAPGSGNALHKRHLRRRRK